MNTMTARDANIYIAAILTTAAETSPGPFPESHAYLATGGDMHNWEIIRGLLIDNGLITIDSIDHSIRLTPMGATAAATISAAIDASKSKNKGTP